MHLWSSRLCPLHIPDVYMGLYSTFSLVSLRSLSPVPAPERYLENCSFEYSLYRAYISHGPLESRASLQIYALARQ
jgi:hypothetical protein